MYKVVLSKKITILRFDYYKSSKIYDTFVIELFYKRNNEYLLNQRPMILGPGLSAGME